MKICILGWYGTETIGDRAILAGIFSLLHKTVGYYEISLGSLYPFYSKRMLQEDKILYRYLLNRDLKVELFESKNQSILKTSIDSSDVVIIGGGPLMDLPELYMLRFAFKYAKKKGKKTIICGCGIGPLFKKDYQICVLDIINLADGIILRDSKSKKILIDLAAQIGMFLPERVKVGFDPAVECALEYKKIISVQTSKASEEIIVNLREFPSEYSNNNNKQYIEKELKQFFESVANYFAKKAILLIPMHYFFIGNDDRYFLNKLNMDLPFTIKNTLVQNKHLSLIETMEKFFYAEFTIGMRFHSVVLQTILNGNNLILDYTEPSKGKIGGFLYDIDKSGFYNNRYINLQDLKASLNLENFRFNENKFQINPDYFIRNQKQYIDAIKEFL